MYLEHQWELKTQTGFTGGAGTTNDKVWIMLLGNYRGTERIYVSHENDTNTFKEGAVGIFHFGTEELGQLISVCIGTESEDNWFVEWVNYIIFVLKIC